MRLRFSDLWRWEGVVDRAPYVTFGVLGFALKHNLDRLIASVLFHREWSPINYLIPAKRGTSILNLSADDLALYATLLVAALPFIWVGVALTVRRLRAVDLPVWFVYLFFAPVLNLVFFLVLSVLPSKPERVGDPPLTPAERRDPLRRLLPDHPWGSAAAAVLITGLVGAAFAAIGTLWLREYGWALFVGLPFCMGMGSVMLYSYHRRHTFRTCLAVACMTQVVLGLALLAFAVEGVICIAMAAPLGLALAGLGGCFGYLLQLRAPEGLGALPWVVLLLAPALLGAAERAAPAEPPPLTVTTTIDIAAPPEVVWRHVVSFSELPPPDEWIFRAGVAHPVRAEICGRGPGAVRRCIFSTGPFIEPIDIWDEPRRLAFSVTENPAPMEEWTPYKQVRPPHLHGFFVSQAGRFELIPLPGGHTRLEGTTWYHHHLWPAAYWQWWSDGVIHTIHRRVLRHIRRLAEEEGAASGK